jgi:hypothetical protein
MLRKLLKHEFFATARIFLPFFGALFILAGLNRVFFSMNVYDAPQAGQPAKIAAVLAMLVYIFVICSIFVLTILVMIQRFYKNLLGDEGYLMNTLPVPVWKHVVSKMLISALWLLVSAVLTVLSVAVLVVNGTFWRMLPHELAQFFAEAYEVFGHTIWLYMAEVCAAGLFTLLSGILGVYAAIALGQLWGRHRVMGAFLAYIGLSTLGNALMSALFVFAGRWLPDGTGPNDPYILWHWMIGLTIFCGAVSMAAFFICTERLLSKKLNLQ